MPHESTNPTGGFRFSLKSGACDSLPAKAGSHNKSRTVASAFRRKSNAAEAGSHTKSRTGGFRLQAEVERG